jgi:glycosyltransferase involved in cell wall biosynthesis
MNVLVLHSQVPFARGGAEVLVGGLAQALRERGHTADVVALPLRWNPPDHLLRAAFAWRMLDLTRVGRDDVDAVICTKFPTWAVEHPNKTLWLVHQHRQAYELYGTPHSEFGPDSAAVRAAVIEIDRRGIGECRRRFAISKNVSNRLRKYCGLNATTLYPPVPTRGLWPEAYEPFILSAARLDHLKRVEAIVAAWPAVSDKLHLIVASDGPNRTGLEQLAERLGVSSRITFVGHVSDERLGDLFRRCRACYYAPIDEDYGYAAVESLTAGKPVITAPDSGGVLEFVRDGVNGTVTELDPASLSVAVNLYADERLARARGDAGRTAADGISWDSVVSSLLGIRA